jgi:Tol biopolymer transport system component
MRIGVRLLPGTIVLLLSLLGLGLLALLIVTFAPTLLELMLVQPTPVVLTRDIGRIAFRCLPNGNNDICLIAANGAGLVNLTNHPAVDRSAIWSPDGDQIAFVSNRTGIYALYTIQADGTQLRHLCDVPLADVPYPTIYGLSWSPDGSRIAFFASDQQTSTGELYTVTLDTRTVSPVARVVNYAGGLAWSPDSTQIAVGVGEPRQVQILHADTGAQVARMEVAETPGWYPWYWQRRNLDPSGRYVVFQEFNQDFPLCTVAYVKRVDGSAARQITEDLCVNSASWAPGGEWLLVTTRHPSPLVENAGFDIYMVHRSGAGLTHLAEGYSPAWAPE